MHKEFCVFLLCKLVTKIQTVRKQFWAIFEESLFSFPQLYSQELFQAVI